MNATASNIRSDWRNPNRNSNGIERTESGSIRTMRVWNVDFGMEKPRACGNGDLENGYVRRGSRDLQRNISPFLNFLFLFFVFGFWGGFGFSFGSGRFQNMAESSAVQTAYKELTDGAHAFVV